MPNETEDSVTRKLLSGENSPVKMDSATVQNETNGNQPEPQELDLRLHDAVCDPDNIEEIETLIEEEPSLIFSRDKDGRSPLHTLAIDADEEGPQIAKLLLGVKEGQDGHLISIERPELLDLQDFSGYTVLHYTGLSRQLGLLSALLSWGADPYLQDIKGNTALHLIAQGMEGNAIECAKELLKSDAKKSLINSTNFNEKTALHTAIDARSILMCTFLLQPENRFNLSQKDKNGWNILHYVCSGTEETDALVEIVKGIISRCSGSHLNQGDSKNRTPLILTSIQRLPRLARILVFEDKTDVLKSDSDSKTALHHACQNGCYPKGSQCVDILISRNFPEKGDAVKYLFRNEDAQGHTPFMYACLNCPSATVSRYVEVVPHSQYWLTGTYATLLYKHCPLALKALMDKAFTEDKKRGPESENTILVDYGAITGYEDPVDVNHQQETKYLKQAIYWEYETKREILLHPLTQLFILRKWQNLGWIIFFWVFWQLLWLAAFTTLVISFYSGTSHSKVVASIASAVMIVYIILSMINEAFEVLTVKLAYLLNVINVAQVTQNVMALIAIFPVITGEDGPQTWQKYATAVGVLLAYILSMRDIGKLHNKSGLVVEVLKQVLIQIVQVLVCCSPLWIGFTLAFMVIFDDEESLNSAFPGPIVKVLVMMTGEFEYNDTFKEDGAKEVSPRVVQLLLFLSFLISVPVAFFNLLTGFALDKVMEMRERAKVGRIAKQLEHIYFIESILLTLRPLRKLLPHQTVVQWLRKLNVTTEWIDQTLKFYTIKKEQLGQSDRRDNSGGCFNFSCRGKVPAEVEQRIYALATINSATKAETQICSKCLK